MAGVTISNSGLLFTNYINKVVETLNHKSRARTRVKQGKKWTGDFLEGRIHTGRTGAIGYTEDGGAFPVADRQKYQPWKAHRRFVHGKIALTDGVMATGTGSKYVARDVIQAEVKGMMRDILKYENGTFFRDGSGSVAQFIGNDITSAATDVPVTDSRMLWKGLQFEVYDSTSALTDPGSPGTLHGVVTVSNVESAPDGNGNALVNFESTLAGVAANDFLVWKNSAARACTGLDKLIDDATGTFQNVNVGNFPHYASLVMDNGGTNRPLTPNLFRQMLAGLMQKSGSDRPDSGLTVLTNAWQSVNVEELYEGELRLSPDTKTSGFAVSSFQSALGRIDIEADTDALYNKMFFADFSQIYRAVQRQLDWRRQNGSIFLRSDQRGEWTATALEIAEYYIEERHTSGKIEDLEETRSTMY